MDYTCDNFYVYIDKSLESVLLVLRIISILSCYNYSSLKTKRFYKRYKENIVISTLYNVKKILCNLQC